MLSKELAAYFAKQFENSGEVTYRPMMGGYLFYYKEKLFGGIYEPGFMIKITQASKKYLPNAPALPPYKGAKNLLLVDVISNQEMLCKMVMEMYEELPAAQSKKR